MYSLIIAYILTVNVLSDHRLHIDSECTLWSFSYILTVNVLSDHSPTYWQRMYSLIILHVGIASDKNINIHSFVNKEIIYVLRFVHNWVYNIASHDTVKFKDIYCSCYPWTFVDQFIAHESNAAEQVMRTNRCSKESFVRFKVPFLTPRSQCSCLYKTFMMS